MKKLSIWTIVFVLLCSLTGCEIKTDQLQNGEKLKNGDLIIMGGQSGISLPVYDMDTFQPLITKSAVVAENMRIVYESLYEYDKNLNPTPMLATGTVISSDGLKLTVSLKNNVVWHDGTPFTADDVVYTVKSIKSNDTLYSKDLKNIVSCSAVGTYTCEFTMQRPTPNVLGLLGFPIIKNETPMSFNADYVPVGTGAYKYKEKQGASQTAFAINESWHGGTASIATIIFKTLKNKESAVYAFEANEVQCITSHTLDLGKYTPKGRIVVSDYVSNQMTFLGMNFYNSVLWGENTRQAIQFVLDKDEIVSGDMYGHAVASDIPINPTAWFARERIIKKDTLKAEQLLLVDGWVKGDDGVYHRDFNGTKQPLSLSIVTNKDNNEKISIANRIASYLNDFGFSTTVKPLPYTEYVSSIDNKQFDLFIGEVELPSNTDPSMLVNSSGNYFTYVSSDMDRIISQMGVVQGVDQTKQAYTEFETLFLKDMPFVPLFFKKGWLVYDSNIRGDIAPNFNNPYKGIGKWHIYNPNNEK